VSEDKEIVVDLLREVLGDERAHYDMKSQITFDCPVCSYDIKQLDKGDGKGNLEVNYVRHVYKCWSCGETHGTQGPLGKLFERFGNARLRKMYNLVRPEEENKQVKKKKIKLPEGYTKFKDSNERFIPHKEALKYLRSRGVTDEMIDKYDIGYTVTGSFAFRIIIPSYNEYGELNYFIARSWVPAKMKYKNPSVPKDEIIFNENRVNFNQDLYIVEGAFDSIFLPNSIPMLGKKMSKILFEKIYMNCMGNVHVVLDGDAWDDTIKLYHELNGGHLYGKIKTYKMPLDKDVCDLRGNIKDYYTEIEK
jgi:DNA primase